MAALHVRPGVLQDLTDIGGRVADWDGSSRVLFDVVLEIALNSLDYC